jgi:hypothetical protein
MKIDIKEVWDQLDVSRNHDSDKFKLVAYEPLNCYLSVLQSTNTRCFELQVNGISLKSFEKKFKGVEVYLVNVEQTKKSILIYLLDTELNEIFTMFIEDLLNNLEGVKQDEDAFQKIQNQFGKWGKIFARINGELLSKERQRGLYGELTFLQSLLNSSSDHTKSIIAWTGPEGSNQDFSNQISATEIKTSKATKPTVNIASELQLDWTVLDSLFLVIVHIDEIRNGTNTLKKLINEIKELISNQSELLQLFEEKLYRVGIPYGEEEHYDETGFVIRSQKAYQVKEGFPALTTEIINNIAVHNIQYQIDITACKPFELSFEQVLNKML